MLAVHSSIGSSSFFPLVHVEVMNTVFSYFIALVLFFVSYLSKKRSCFSLVFLSIFPVVVLLLCRLNKLLSIWIICHNCHLFDLCPFTIFLVDKSTVGLIY